MNRTLWVGIALLLCSRSAEAMSDGGESAELIAVAGHQGRYAVLAYEGMQEPCGLDPCELFVVDLSKAEFMRLQVKKVKLSREGSPTDLFHAYRRRLSAPWRNRLTDPMFPKTLKRAAFTLSLSEATAARNTPAGRYRAELRINSRVASMDAYDGQGNLCPAIGRAKPLCPSCKPTQRTLNRETVKTFVCTRPISPGQCDCQASANIVRFSVDAPGRAEPILGNLFLVAPYALGQAIMGGEANARIDLKLRSVSMLTTPTGTLFWGSAAHAPRLNGTYFPVVAILPST